MRRGTPATLARAKPVVDQASGLRLDPVSLHAAPRATYRENVRLFGYGFS